jgi:hypothetical protein
MMPGLTRLLAAASGVVLMGCSFSFDYDPSIFDSDNSGSLGDNVEIGDNFNVAFELNSFQGQNDLYFNVEPDSIPTDWDAQLHAPGDLYSNLELDSSDMTWDAQRLASGDPLYSNPEPNSLAFNELYTTLELDSSITSWDAQWLASNDLLGDRSKEIHCPGPHMAGRKRHQKRQICFLDTSTDDALSQTTYSNQPDQLGEKTPRCPSQLPEHLCCTGPNGAQEPVTKLFQQIQGCRPCSFSRFSHDLEEAIAHQLTLGVFR